MTVSEDTQAAILKVPAGSWTPAYDGNGQVRDGAWVADITGLLDLFTWPAGMRLIVRKERPHPGAQLRFTDVDGHRLTAFATDAKRGQLADLELRHRRRSRCEDRIRNAKDTGLRNLPLKGFAANHLWCEIVSLACELLAWTQLLALTGAGPPLGTETAPPARLRRRRAPGAQRPPPPAPPRRAMALGPRHHCRSPPLAGPAIRLNSRNRPDDQEGSTRGPWNPVHPARQPGSSGTASTRKSTPAEHLRPADYIREGSRLCYIRPAIPRIRTALLLGHDPATVMSGSTSRRVKSLLIYYRKQRNYPSKLVRASLSYDTNVQTKILAKLLAPAQNLSVDRQND